MPKRIRVRTLTTEEVAEIKRIANSRKEPIRLVQRARIIEGMHDEADLTASDAGLKAGFRSNVVGPIWVKRFNEESIAGLQDRPRSGRKPIHSEEVRSALIDLALQKPKTLGYPFEMWTLERLQVSFEERQGVHLSDSTIWSWMEAEGFNWKRQQSWFRDAEKHDPEFVEKRGA